MPIWQDATVNTGTGGITLGSGPDAVRVLSPKFTNGSTATVGYGVQIAMGAGSGGGASYDTDENITDVNTDGWSIDYTSPPTFDPVADPKYLTLSRAGFDTSGNTTTYQENLIITKRVRQAYPNQASLDSTRCALSDYVYDTDTILGGSSPTNGSTEASPKPVANWCRSDRRVVGNTFPKEYLEVTAHHRNARTREQVACVKWTISDGTNSVTATQSTSVISGHAGDLHPVIVYRPANDVDISSLSSTTLTVNAEVFPWIGDADSVLDSADSAVVRGFSPRTYLKNPTLYSSPPYAYVLSTGNDGTGVVSTTAATARATPFLTVKGAIEGLKAASGVTGGFVDGCIIRVGNGVTFLGANVAAGTYQSVAELIIERDELTTRADAQITFGTTSAYASRCSFIRFRDLSLVRTNTQAICGTVTPAKLILEEVNFDNGSHNASWLSAATSLYGYMLGVTITNPAANLLAPATNQELCLVRGVSFGTAGTSRTVEGWLVLGCTLAACAVGRGATSRTQSGSIIAFNRFNAPPSASDGWNPGSSEDIPGGAVFSQNILEPIHTTSATVGLGVSRDSATGNCTHIIMHHNTMLGANILGRGNIGYDDGATARTNKLYSLVGNIWSQFNIKGDVFVTDGARVGNWGVLYGAGSQGEFTQFVDADGGNWKREYPGLNASIGTNAITRNDPLFVSYAATTVSAGPSYSAGAGGGNYALQSGSPCEDRVTNPVFRFDMAGSTRPANDDASGAYAAA